MTTKRAVVIIGAVLLALVMVYIIGITPLVRDVLEIKRISAALHNVSRDRLAVALQDFVRDHKTNNTTLPFAVPLDQLISGRYLHLEDVRGLERRDVLVSLTPDMAVPQAVLIRVHSSNASDFVLLADGSVQGSPRQ